MARKVNLNADMAEGFGAYDIGNDTALLDIVTSANVACGFHAGDPNVMDRVCKQAKAKGVSIGAHPGFNDLWGFGRRAIPMPAGDVERMVIYQIGALQGIAAANGMKVTHMKTHGALGNMAAVDPELAAAVVRGTKAVDPSLILLVPTGSELLKAAEKAGMTYASEVFADRTYTDDGELTPRRLPNAMVHDPAEAVERVLRMVEDQEVVSTSGKRIPAGVHSICVHGDGPTAVEVATAVRRGLEAAGVSVVPLPDLGLA
ncbi:MAG: 5-oxoprolinase subunit PxpA [Thalassobaculum sp.]|uniref:LamB/YcsF family protein n=1 Tax=Thalassobaculum sp. TaxID=2022740 RepID=UPI0032EE19E4